jgi:hypothetical protein
VGGVPESPPGAPRYSTAQDMYQHIIDCGGPLACRPQQPIPFCRKWYPQAAPANAAVLAMICGHLPVSDWMFHQVILLAWILLTPALIPPAPAATLTLLPLKCSILPTTFPGCTSSTVCCSALPAAQGAIQFPNSILKGCRPLTGLLIATSLTSLLPIYGRSSYVRHPPLHRPLSSTLTFHASLLIP